MHKSLVPLAAAATFLVAVLIIIYLFAGGNEVRRNVVVLPSNFAECVAQGYPVMEIYPAQCRAGGQTFTDPTQPAAPAPDPVTFDNVQAGQVIASPMTVYGTVIGGWCFEGVCPIRVLDGNGKELGVAQAKVANWQTDQFVPFEATIKFAKPTTDIGTLELSNDNPSGLPENDKKAGIPVRFK